jgi:hypothetical protein
MFRTSRPFSLLAVAGAATAISVLTACSDGSGPSSVGASSPASAAAVASSAGVEPAAAAAAAAGAGAEPAKACAALPALDAAFLAYPGADPDGPAPTPAQLAAWAATAAAPLQVIAANIPAQLDPDVLVVKTAVAAAAKGTALKEDPSLSAARAAIDGSAHDHCGFVPLDVTGTGIALTGVPAAVSAGTVGVSFTNKAPAGKAGFVLLVARVHDGANYSLAQIRNNTVDLASISDIVIAAQPDSTGTAYAAASLRPGHYVVASPLGTPPSFTGTLVAGFDVH